MKLHDVEVADQAIGDFCRKHLVGEMRLFGSITRDDFGPGSDVDVIVAFKPEARVGLIGFAGMEIELEELFGRPVHLHTPDMLHRYFRRQIMTAAEVVYGEPETARSDR